MALRKLLVPLCLLTTLLTFVLPAANGADERAGHPKRIFDGRAVLGANFQDMGNGHFKLRLRDGKSVITHGPDFLESHGLSISPGDPERSPACATDYYQHVLYGRSAATADRYATMKASIQGSMRRINAALNEAALESGSVTADYKVLCDVQGQIAVGQFTNTATSSFTDIINAAKAAGFNKTNVDYTIYYDGAGPAGTCGIASLYWDERLSATNYNNNGGGFAVSYSGCWEMIPMHENGHNQGAVQFYAPNGTGDGGHCQDEQDVMCYADGGSRYTGLIQRCTTELRFDCGYDDYFDASPEPGEYLAGHWNMGSPLNRFIRFGSTVIPPPPPTATPTPTPTNGDPDPSTPTLTNNVRRAGTAGTVGTWRYYKIYVPAGKARLWVYLDGPACTTTPCASDLNLYTRRSAKPTLSTYICAARTGDADEVCTYYSPISGWYYFGIYNNRGPAVAHTIRAIVS